MIVVVRSGLLILFASAALTAACGGTSDKPSGDGDGDGEESGSGGADGSGGVGTGGGDDAETGGAPGSGGEGWTGDSSDTVGCPNVPPSKVLPIVGPFQSGPHPGPCSSDDVPMYIYDGDLVSEAPGVGETYVRDEQDRIVTVEANFGWTYAYSPGEIFSESEVTDDQRMILDERGYAQEIYLESGGTVLAAFEYVYEDCRLVRRDVIAGSPEYADTTYSYDAEGNLVTRMTGDVATNFDYSCW